jgi:hypothetical protein
MTSVLTPPIRGVVTPSKVRFSVVPASAYWIVCAASSSSFHPNVISVALDQIDRHPGVLLGLDPIGAEEIGLLPADLEDEYPSHDEPDDCRRYQQLGESEAAFVAEMSHGRYRFATYMVTVLALAVPAAERPVPVMGR